MAYFDYLKDVLSWHYFVEAGEIFQAAVAKPIDDLIAATKQAVVQRFWQYCEDAGLPYLLQNYNLDAIEAFTPSQSRQQVADAWLTWEGDGTPSLDGHKWGGGGTEEGILTELARLGYRAAIIPVWQYQQRSDGITDTITVQPTLRPDINHQFWPVGNLPFPFVYQRDIATQGAFDGEWWIDINLHASSFWIVLDNAPFAFRRWGDPGQWGTGFWDALVTGDRVNLQRIYATIRKFTSPEIRCRGVVFSQAGRYLLTNPLAVVAVASTYDAWTVGAAGYAAHWDGYRWVASPTGSTADLRSICTVGARVYVAGTGGTILRWTAGIWAAEVSGTGSQLNSICCAGSDVWAVGAGGVILRNQGTGWATTVSPVATDLNCIYAVGPNDIWAVGAGGVSIHWNGTAWSIKATGVAAALYGIWAVSAAEVWAVGAGGAIIKWTTIWASVSSPTTADLYSIAGIAAQKDGSRDGRAIAVGDALLVYNGTAWALALSPVGARARSVSGTVEDNFWIPTDTGEVLNLTVTGNIFSSARWNHFDWGDGSRYNLKYVIKYMREGWEV